MNHTLTLISEKDGLFHFRCPECDYEFTIDDSSDSLQKKVIRDGDWNAGHSFSMGCVTIKTDNAFEDWYDQQNWSDE